MIRVGRSHGALSGSVRPGLAVNVAPRGALREPGRCPAVRQRVDVRHAVRPASWLARLTARAVRRYLDHDECLRRSCPPTAVDVKA